MKVEWSVPDVTIRTGSSAHPRLQRGYPPATPICRSAAPPLCFAPTAPPACFRKKAGGANHGGSRGAGCPRGNQGSIGLPRSACPIEWDRGSWAGPPSEEMYG
jgi:hypothetical protein